MNQNSATGEARSAGWYRKVPVVIQAMQWDQPEAAWDLIEWADGSVDYAPDTAGPADPGTDQDWGLLTVTTLEGDHHATPGDWLIRGVKGEFYFCKPDIFAATYEAADSPPSGVSV